MSCPDVLETLSAKLIIGEPTAPTAGTVLFFAGGGGTGDWVGTDETAAGVVRDVQAAGFRTVQVQWDRGWLDGESAIEGHAKLACRPATVTSWIHDESGLHQDGGFCATGNSGGAAQIAYMLSHYGLDETIDLAVVSEGPPTAAMDRGCFGNDPDDQPFRYLPVTAARIDLGFGFESGGPCATRDASQERLFQEASVLAPGADLDHPATAIHVLLGERSDSEAHAHARAWFEALNSADNDVSLEIVARTPHRVQSTVEGAAAIRDAIVTDCRPRG